MNPEPMNTEPFQKRFGARASRVMPVGIGSGSALRGIPE
jgi:hypothetical protein